MVLTMKSERDLKLECLKLASMLATGKTIRPDQVIPQAMEYFRWVDKHEELANEGDVTRLASHFRR